MIVKSCLKSIIVIIFIFIVSLPGCKLLKKGKARSYDIEYVSMWKENEPQALYFKEMITLFEQEYSIKVACKFAGRDILNTLKSRFRVGEVPDLIDQDCSELSNFFFNNEIPVESLNTFYFQEKGPENQEKLIDIFDTKLLDLYKNDDKYYFFPYSFITSGFFYNKKLFQKYNITPPHTWKDFIKNNEMLKYYNCTPLALDGNINFYNAYYFYWLCQRIMGKDALLNASKDRSGKSWDKPGFLKAAGMVYELSKSGRNLFQHNYENSIWPFAQNEWASSGNIGSILCGSWIPQETYRIAADSFDYGFYPFPEVIGGKGKTSDVEVYLIGFAIPKAAGNIEGAKKFLQFISRKEHADRYIDMTKNLSARYDAKYPEYLKEFKSIIMNARSFHVSYDGVMAKSSEWTNTVFFPNNDLLIFGKITPREFIARMKKDTIKVLKK